MQVPTAPTAVTGPGSTVTAMTVVDDTYTGHVETQDRRAAHGPGASIIKMSVGPMDNNAYLVTCAETGESVLIDAANDAELLVELGATTRLPSWR